MGKQKRMVKLCMIPVLALGLVSGCSKNQSENIIFESANQAVAPQTELSFFGFKYEALNVTAIEEALHRFMLTYPDIIISYDGIKSPEYFDVLEKRLSTGNADDIIMVDHERLLALGGSGMLADLSSLSTLDNFSPLSLSQMSAGGQINYVPTSISAFGLYCNEDLLNAHGQEIPENLAELEAVCDYFVSQGITPIIANNDISLKTIVIAKSMLPYYRQEDPVQAIRAFNENGKDLAEALSPGFELVEQMIDRKWIDCEEALATSKTKDDLVLFAEGSRPFMLTGAWAVPRVRSLSPSFQFSVHPYPILDDGSVLVINIDTRISVMADSPQLEEAKKFVEYMTQPDVMWKFVDSQCSFSPLAESRLAEDTAIQPIGSYLSNGRSVIGSDDNLQYPIWNHTRQCIEGMLCGNDAQAAVSHMEELLLSWND